MSSARAAHPPNVLLLLADDLGWDDLRHHGNPWLETPQLDALAQSAVQFANYYVASVCAPSRAALLTGRHFLRTGVAHVHGGKDYVHRDELLLPQVLQRVGYRTGMWGKWHAGTAPGYRPWERGFDEAYMAGLYQHRDGRGSFNGAARACPGWTVDALTDMAIAFMTQQRRQPFFAFVPYLSIHAPLRAPDPLIERYERKGVPRTLATVYAMVAQLDSNVGRLLDAVAALGLADDTIVLFMSDNGPACLEGILSDAERRLRNVNGYKGHKGNMWENGIKSPLFVRWGARFAPHTVQRVCDICDVFPTLLDLCGVALPTPAPKLDGRSIAAYLRGDERTLPPKESYLWVNEGWPPDPARPYSVEGIGREYDPIAPEAKAALALAQEHAGVRTEAWKYLWNADVVPDMPAACDQQVLIHISEDAHEDRNVLADEPAQAAALRARLQAWFDEIKAEPHAFAMPVFTIDGGAASSVVPAYAPVRLHGGVRNTCFWLANLCEPGDGADYAVTLPAPGDYELTLDYECQAAGSITMQAQIAGQTRTATLSDTHTQVVGMFTLPAGEHTLHVRVAAVATSATVGLSKLCALRFRRAARELPAAQL